MAAQIIRLKGIDADRAQSVNKVNSRAGGSNSQFRDQQLRLLKTRG